MIATVILGSLIALPAFLFMVFFGLLHGRRYEMDWAGGFASGCLSIAIYRRIYWVIFSLSFAGAFAVTRTSYPVLGFVWASATIHSLLFNLWLTYCYEQYLHSKYPKNPPPPIQMFPSGQEHTQEYLGGIPQTHTAVYWVGPTPYTAWKYAITMALAIAGLLTFLLAFLTTVDALIER